MQGTARASSPGVELIPGERIGNYRIECERETIGTGLLYEAQHLVVPRRALIKVLPTERARDRSRVVQALREASILESIAHPGVPIIYEAGCLADREPWFAFEANHGPTLDLLLACGSFPVVAVAALLRDIADILEHAQARGVIHRGLRPSRIVVSVAGRYPLCIADWSDAIVHDAAAHAPQTIPDASRSYVAPELLRHGGGYGEVLDGRVDVFSLGVIAHRALTGGLPYAPGLGAEPFAPSHQRRPDAPRGLTTLLDAMLAYRRTDRPSAAEVRAGIERLFTAAPEQHAAFELASEAAAAPSVSPEALVVLAERRYIRRPRWTPEVRYAEAIDTTRDNVREVATPGPDEFTD
jgi:serine/threonine protein kinase